MVSLTACLYWTPSFHCYSLLIVIQVLWTCIILCQVCHRHAREHTASWRQRVWISRGSVHILRKGTKHVPNALMRHTNTNGCRASRFKAYVKCIRTPSPREKDCGRSVKSLAKENKHVCKEICFAKVVRNPIGLQRILFGKSINKCDTKLFNDLKSKNSLLDTEDVDTWRLS